MTLNHSSVPLGTADTNIYTHGKSLRTHEKETLGNKVGCKNEVVPKILITLIVLLLECRVCL